MSAVNYIPTGSNPAPHKAGSSFFEGLRRLNNYLFEPSLTPADRKTKLAQKELRSVGFSRFQLDRRESRHIAAYVNPGEHIRAGIRGHIFDLGGVLMVATDSRILYLHDIPLFSNFEEFAYDMVSGISVHRAGYLSSVTVFTKLKTYQIDYINPRQAERFLEFVESQIYKPALQNAVKVGRDMLSGARIKKA